MGIPAVVGNNVSHLTLIGTVEGNRSLVDDSASLTGDAGRATGAVGFIIESTRLMAPLGLTRPVARTEKHALLACEGLFE